MVNRLIHATNTCPNYNKLSIKVPFIKMYENIYNQQFSRPRLYLIALFNFRFCKIAGIEQKFLAIDKPLGGTKSVYQLTWATYGIQPSLRRGYRTSVPVSLKFKIYKELNFKLQCKFYEQREKTHSCTGQPLNYAFMSCRGGSRKFDSVIDNMKYQ